MTRRLDRLQRANATPQGLYTWAQRVCEQIEATFDRIETLIADLTSAVAAIAAAQAAADAANAAAAAADAAATNAQTTADNITTASELGTSYVTGTPPIIQASDAGANVTITIAAHTRNYPQPDGTVVPVSVAGGTLTGRSYSTLYYVYYDDPARAGGSVSYQSTTTEATAAQIGDRHTVGSSPPLAAADPPTDGAYVRPPGPGQFSQL